jgi:hypothetical protein
VEAEDRVRVYFDLEVDDSGYPPVSSEYLWCASNREGYVIDNIPFYAREVSMGDLIKAEASGGILKFQAVVRASSNSTIRVFVKREDAVSRIISELRMLGCETEKMESLPLIAVSLPSHSQLEAALQFLDSEAESGVVAIEESAVRYQ